MVGFCRKMVFHLVGSATTKLNNLFCGLVAAQGVLRRSLLNRVHWTSGHGAAQANRDTWLTGTVVA